MTDTERIELLEEKVRALEEAAQKNGKHRNISDTERELVEMYGPYVDKTIAAKLLCVTRATVYKMLLDERIQASHGGGRVTMKSIAKYIDSTNGKGCCTGRKMRRE